MEDEAIIRLYWDRDENAIAETDRKYGKLCFQVANHLLCNNEDSQECVNDTYLTVWNNIPPTRPRARITSLLFSAKSRETFP